MAAKKVYVQQAIDEAVYFVNDEVTYEAVPAENEEGDTTKFIVVVKFTPQNGPDRGKEHAVPFSRVIAVVDDSHSGA